MDFNFCVRCPAPCGSDGKGKRMARARLTNGSMEWPYVPLDDGDAGLEAVAS